MFVYPSNWQHIAFFASCVRLGALLGIGMVAKVVHAAEARLEAFRRDLFGAKCVDCALPVVQSPLQAATD